MKVRKSDLGQLAFLAEGGFGKVYRADGFRLPHDPTALAYKEFTTQHAEQAKSARAAVEFRAGLSAADRDELDVYGTWPRALVEDAGAVCGLLMPLIPPDFFCRLADPGGRTTSRPRDLSWLITTAGQRRTAQVDLGDIDHAERLMVLALLVYAIGRLHKHGWVFGDVSFKNAVFALEPPRLMLLDCDGAAALQDTARKQFSTPYWDPPECPIAAPAGQQPQLQDKVSDAYKLGLAILRCLTLGKGAGTVRSASRLAGELDATGAGLVTRALSDNRGQRPTARELYDHLYLVVLSHIKIPEVLSARLTKPFILRGQDARIEWQIQNASKVTIVAGNNSRLTADLAAHPRGFAFRPDRSGPVSIEMRNRLATVSVDLGEITLYELPPFSVDLNYLPRPQVPAIGAFSLAPLEAILAGPPRAGVGMTAIPPVPSPPAFDLVKSLLPGGPGTVPLPRIDEAVIEVSNAVKNMILSEGTGYAATLRQAKLGG